VEHLFHAPILTLALGVGATRFHELKAAGQPIPEPVQVRSLLDTGGCYTLADFAVVESLGLEANGRRQVFTPGGTVLELETFVASLYIGSWSTGALTLGATSLRSHLIDVIVGRDILQFALFIYDPRNASFSLNFGL
jgi:predicted aspartyl protease